MVSQLAQEPGSGEVPVAFHRNADRFGCFLFGEPSEEAQLHRARGTGLELLHAVQCLVNLNQIFLPVRRETAVVRERHPHLATPAFLSQARSDVFDE